MKKKLFLTMLALCTFVCLSCTTNSNKNIESKKDSEQSSPESLSDTNKKNNNTKDVKKIKKNDEILKIGKESQLGDWKIKLEKIKITKEIKQNDYFNFQADEGNQYLCVYLTIKNTAKDSATFLPSFSIKEAPHSKIMYQNEYEFTATQLLGLEKDLHDSSLNPLSSKKGLIAFEIPDEVISSEEELLFILEEGEKEVKYKIR